MAAQVMDALDQDGNGTISYLELLSILKPLRRARVCSRARALAHA